MSTSHSMSDLNKDLVAEFRANGGKVSGPFASRLLLLLTTVGAKSGVRRPTPLVYARDGDRYVVAASLGNAPTNPAWYHNLLANPLATVEIGTETFEARSFVASGQKRDRLAALLPNLAELQTRTTRRIPVLVLERT